MAAVERASDNVYMIDRLKPRSLAVRLSAPVEVSDEEYQSRITEKERTGKWDGKRVPKDSPFAARGATHRSHRSTPHMSRGQRSSKQSF